MDRLLCQVESIDTVPVQQLPSEMLASSHGGPLLTSDDGAPLKPRRALYRVRVRLQDTPTMQQARLASFVLPAQPTSVAYRVWRGVVSAITLQTSF